MNEEVVGVLEKMKQRFCERPRKILIYPSRFWQKRRDRVIWGNWRNTYG